MSLEPWGIYAVSGLKATKKEREKKKKRKGEKIERCFAESRVVGEVTRHVKIKNGKFDNFSGKESGYPKYIETRETRYF